jgi:tyrosine-specific transport protein
MDSSLAHKISVGPIIGAISIIAGTCIGGGMLALPVETAVVGLYPALLSLFIAWAFMLITGLYLVEASLWVERDAHYLTLSSRLLGKWGKYLATALYLFMGYGSLVGYSSGGSLLLMSFSDYFLHFSLDRVHACAIFTMIFGLCLYFGPKVIGKVNTILLGGMILSYFLIVTLGVNHIDVRLFTHSLYKEMPTVFPLMLATFSYQMVMPSLTTYLNRNPKALRLSVILGTTIPFVIYAIWETIVFGIVPFSGEAGLLEALKEGYTATDCLKSFVTSSWLSLSSELFAIFAIVTSFLGIGLGLFDFLADLTKIRKTTWGKFWLGLLVILPTLTLAVCYPKAFSKALALTGGFGDAILSILMPVAMVFMGRFIKRYEGPYTVIGGKPLMLLVALFGLAVFIVQLAIF